MQRSAHTIVSGGSGYVVGDAITLVGGTFTTAITFTVATVSGTAVATLTLVNGGTYSVLPTGTLTTTTTGAGTGLTLTIDSWGVRAVNITSAGSGYIDQPTITFSGGSAAAYATVGTSTNIRSLGSSVTLQTPGSTQLVVQDDSTTAASSTPVYIVGASSSLGRAAIRSSKALYIASASTNPISFLTNSTSTSDGTLQLNVANTTSAVNYLQVTGASTTNSPSVSAQGSDTNIGISYTTKGTGGHSFLSNSGSTQLFRVNNTTSAVNYIQITGGVTGGNPWLSTNGSDTDINLRVSTKGAGSIIFQTGGGSEVTQFYVTHTAAVTNYLQVTGSVTGSAPSLAAGSGSNTNVDLGLKSKGSGVVLINGNLGITSLTATTSATTADQVLATFDATLYRSMKLSVQAVSGTNYHLTKLMALHNGATAQHTEFGTVVLGSACASYSVDYSGSTVRLLATPTSATATTYKIAAYLTRI
jgi:hypothetical protein